MKKTIFLTLLFAMLALNVFSQQVQEIEYATVTFKVFYQGNLIHNDHKGLSKSPTLVMGGKKVILMDTSDENNPKKFAVVNDALDYMAKFGWRVISSNIVPYMGDSGNTSRSSIFNTNLYMQVVLFERPYSLEKQ